jgi:hypothetical protein
VYIYRNLLVVKQGVDRCLHDGCFMESVMNVACYGWLAFSSVNETFVSRDWDFDVTLCETAPVLLNEIRVAICVS